MSKFEKVKKYYDNGLWNAERVANAVIKGWITVDEFREITGVAYDI
ncbi:MAG: XkdX family protein [Clostridia bacterium]|nr:XkdX family protein [Clostridia bacterium]